MKQIVILEGPDGAGKTTLAEELNRTYGFEIIHTGPPDPGEDVLRSYAKKITDALAWPGPVVFDRLFLGELVYGPVMRGRSLLSERGALLMDRLIRGQGVKVVLCLPPYQVCVNNWKARKGKEYVQDTDKFREIYGKYALLGSKYPHYMVYDYTERQPMANYLANRGQIGAAFIRAIGQPRAPFLFLGEIANQVDLDLPFFSDTGVSPWLDACIDEAGYLEEERLYANAYKLDKMPSDLYLIYTALSIQNPRLEVIALGRKAAERCRVAKIPHHELPHPQYWKRFQSRERYRYVNWLKEIHANHTYNNNRWVKVS